MRWPRYVSHFPAGDTWSVVHFPFALSSTRRPWMSLPSQAANGSSSSSRSEPGATATVTLARIARGRREPARAAIEPTRRQVVGDRRVELPEERPVESAAQGHAHDRLRRADERERVLVAVVPGREVAVERGHDHVRSVGRVVASPLPDARPARVRQHGRADGFEVGEQPVALDRRPDLFGPRRDHERRLDAHSPRRRLAGQVRRSPDVFIGGVRARPDERGGDLLRVTLARGLGRDLRHGPIEVGRVRTDEMRFQRRQVDLDDAVEEAFGIGVHLGVVDEVLGVSVGKIGHSLAPGRLQVFRRVVVVGEQRTGCADLGAHVADSRFPRRRDRLRARAEVLDDGAGAPLDAEDARDLQDDVLGRGPARQRCR